MIQRIGHRDFIASSTCDTNDINGAWMSINANFKKYSQNSSSSPSVPNNTGSTK
jgi:hypothetical protein